MTGLTDPKPQVSKQFACQLPNDSFFLTINQQEPTTIITPHHRTKTPLNLNRTNQSNQVYSIGSLDRSKITITAYNHTNQKRRRLLLHLIFLLQIIQSTQPSVYLTSPIIL
ncbi:hypothetical protein H4Q26_014519 [Puccinia striiformis f. sp. tritici PST-130]|nr:hypothetical protein H4Q26_013169 [Puccinia striiformis f. sp. tritici PST-130]KAI9623354.1 hypothetical protein H4Q26_014519 [Puccinia striiformis f. sp. tritici PST-130]